MIPKSRAGGGIARIYGGKSPPTSSSKHELVKDHDAESFAVSALQTNFDGENQHSLRDKRQGIYDTLSVDQASFEGKNNSIYALHNNSNLQSAAGSIIQVHS